MEDLCAGKGQVRRLVVGDHGQGGGIGHERGIGVVEAVHILVEEHLVGAERRGDGHGGGIAAAPAQRGEGAVAAHALESGGHHDVVPLEILHDPRGISGDDLGVAEAVVGGQSQLRLPEGDGGDAHGVELRGEQGGGNALAAAE